MKNCPEAGFQDHFSREAGAYARFRPRYPDALFQYLASVSPASDCAWDCGTGNGQAAVALARHFLHVVATDASEEQIRHAEPHERVEYRIQRSEDVVLPRESVDLVTAAVAVHWFDLDAYYRRVHRVLKPAGVLAVWTYHLPRVTPLIDDILSRFYASVLEGYWPERFRYVDDGYASLPFPYSAESTPRFTIATDWSLGHLIGFLASWSATRKFEEVQGQNPVELVESDLVDAWEGGGTEVRRVEWPLHLKMGRKPVRQ